jgi:hypothetical protein
MRWPGPRLPAGRRLRGIAGLAMELFTKLFGNLLIFLYHCFDRIVIHGYLSGLSQSEQVVHFFHGIVFLAAVAKEVLERAHRRLPELGRDFARNHRLPIEWAKRARKEDHVLHSSPARNRGPHSLSTRLDTADGEIAAPEANRIFPHAERLGDLWPSPTRQRQPDGPRPVVGLSTISGAGQSHQDATLFVACRNRRLSRYCHIPANRCLHRIRAPCVGRPNFEPARWLRSCRIARA